MPWLTFVKACRFCSIAARDGRQRQETPSALSYASTAKGLTTPVGWERAELPMNRQFEIIATEASAIIDRAELTVQRNKIL